MMKKYNPLVSVVMPVYNSVGFLQNSVESILTQDYPNFEFIIIDDCSTDNSLEVIKKYNDTRIKLIENPQNRGNYFCRNIGCRIAQGKYIAVMDCDDISMPNRLTKQVEVMEKSDDLLAVGSDHILLFPNGQEHNRKRIKEYKKIRLGLLKDNVALHPSLIIRKDIFKCIGFYNEEFYYSSDYDMLCRLSIRGKIIGIPEILVKYRLHREQISFVANKLQGDYANIIRLRYLESCGFHLNKTDGEVYVKFMQSNIINQAETNSIERILNNLLEQNFITNFFDQDSLYSFFRHLTLNAIINAE